MSQRKPLSQDILDARRAQVSALFVRRMPYRAIARELGLAYGTVAADIKALRKEWAKERGDSADRFEESLYDLDALQNEAMTTLQGLVGTDRLAVIDRVLRINDQRNKLLGLYPKHPAEEPDIPTGPIQIDIKLVETGNRRLLHEGEYTDAETGDGDTD